MVDVFETIDVPLAIVYKDRWRTPSMSLRRKTVPPTQKHPRSSSSGRKELIAKEKTEKQSVRKRTVLDNRFHRTVPPTQKHPRSSSSGRKELIAKEKTEKQSVR